MTRPFGQLAACLLLAAQSAAAPALAAGGGRGERRLVQFPDMFVGTWGAEGARCMQYPGRSVITRRSIRYRSWFAGTVDATPLAHNRLRVRFHARSPVARATMILTVGTAGSRLFIERSERVIAILHYCER